jgi:hypothetical protein
MVFLAIACQKEVHALALTEEKREKRENKEKIEREGFSLKKFRICACIMCLMW